VTVSGVGQPYTATWETITPSFVLNDSFSTCVTTAAYSGPAVKVVKSITLPNNQQYTFSYDPVYGLLNKVVYPSGGYISYTWGPNAQSEWGEWLFVVSNGNSGCVGTYDTYALQSRTVSFDGVNVALQQSFSYATTWSPSQGGKWTSKQTTVTTTDKVRGASSQTVYTFAPSSAPLGPYVEQAAPVSSLFAMAIPVEQSIVYKDSTGKTLQTVGKTWSDAYTLNSVQTILDDGKTTSQVIYPYGALGDIFLEEDEYDYGQATPTKVTKNTYQTFGNSPVFGNNPDILDRLCQSLVYDGSGNLFAETDYLYDGGTAVCGAAGNHSVTSVSNLPSGTHDETNYAATSTTARGNLTQKTRKLLTSGTSPSTTYTYDETGQVLSMTDPCGNATCSDMAGTSHRTGYSYADSYTTLSGGTNMPFTPASNTNAFVTQITDPLGYTRKFTYDYNNGQLTVSQDQNSERTTYIYNDSLARPTQVNYPDGGQIEYAYNDTASHPSATTCELINGTAGAICSPTNPTSGWKTSVAVMDGLGHIVQTQLASDPDGVTYAGTTYDGLGRPYKVSNPYRTTSDSTYGTTTFTYDALGRTTQVAEPDGSIVSTSYSRNQTTVTDEIGNQRTSQTDGLERLTTVWEAPNNTNYNYQTVYTYDPLNNLLGVNQTGGSRPRTFTYDSLSRLLCAANPEVQVVTCPASGTTFPTGAITYTYDLNSNLSSKVAPKPGQTGTATVTTNYSYDALNRITQKSYSDGTTLPAVFGYDQTNITMGTQQFPITNSIGRLSWTCVSQQSPPWCIPMTAFSYDAMGRPLFEARSSSSGSSAQYKIYYSYYKDGSLNTLTYPSGDVVTYTVGGVGRTTQLSDSGNNYVGYSGHSATYTPNGSLASMINGYTSTFAGIVTSNIYNDRLQPILLSASVASSPIFSLCYDFHLGVAVNSAPCSFNKYATGDNGNVFQILNNVDSTRSAAYIYDPLNRIAQAYTLNTVSKNCWGETYSPTATAPGVVPSTPGIDAWGNLTNRSGVSGMTGCATEGLSASADNQNHLSILTYDAAGNVTNDGNGNQPTYDAENRIATDAGVTYYYDADGMRMEKSSGTMYWPGPYGTLAETDLTGTINHEYIYFNGTRIARVDRPSATVHYYFSNHLGSHTMVTSATGSCEQDIDYYPYGGVMTDHCPNVAQHYKFTGKERDSESGLDDFGFRYYGSSMGRFMSPDEALYGGDFEDPQKLNLYSYVRNNPLNSIDPDGHLVVVCTKDESGKQTCTQMSDQDYYNAVDKAVNSNTGINAPKWGQTGDITCGGVVCGHATYLDEGAVNPLGEQYLTDYAGGKITGRVLGALIGTVAGWFGRGAENAATDAATETVNLADKKATTHILDGDATGGGHAPGVGIAGKSEFPAGWGRDKIMHAISDVATDPTSKVTQAGRSTLVEGTREGVNIRVVIRDGRIVTGYPTNLPRNP